MRNVKGFKLVKQRVYEKPTLAEQIFALEDEASITHNLHRVQNNPKLSSRTVKRCRKAAEKKLALLQLRGSTQL